MTMAGNQSPKACDITQPISEVEMRPDARAMLTAPDRSDVALGLWTIIDNSQRERIGFFQMDRGSDQSHH